MNNKNLQSQAAAIFLKAATYIRQYGWQEEGMGEYGQPRCSMGALDSACPRGEWDNDTAELMHQALYDELKGQSLTSFNHKFCNGEKVAELYERVAQKMNYAD